MRRRRPNAGFSAAELSLCFLTIAALSTLIYVIGQNSGESARDISCDSNVRQLSLAMRMYMADNGGRGPIGDVRAGLIQYTKNEQIFVCPSEKSRTPAGAPPPPDGRAQQPGLSPGFRNSYAFATGVWDDGFPRQPVVQDSSPTAHLNDTFQLGRLDGAVRRVPASRWYLLQ